MIAFDDVVVRYPRARTRRARRRVARRRRAARSPPSSGPNGSGKSTLVRALVGRVPLRVGRHRRSTARRSTATARPLARRASPSSRSARSPRFPLDVREYVALGRYPHLGVWRGAGARRSSRRSSAPSSAPAIAPFVDRRDHASCPAASGSAFASRARSRRAARRSCSTSRRPFSTSATRWQSSSCSADSPRDGQAVLLVSHQLNLVARFADHIVLLHRGRVAAAGTPADVMQAPRPRARLRVAARRHARSRRRRTGTRSSSRPPSRADASSILGSIHDSTIPSSPSLVPLTSASLLADRRGAQQTATRHGAHRACRRHGDALAARARTACPRRSRSSRRDQLRAEGHHHRRRRAACRCRASRSCRPASYGGATSLFIRGGESKYTKVLVDGVPVNDAGGALRLLHAHAPTTSIASRSCADRRACSTARTPWRASSRSSRAAAAAARTATLAVRGGGFGSRDVDVAAAWRRRSALDYSLGARTPPHGWLSAVQQRVPPGRRQRARSAPRVGAADAQPLAALHRSSSCTFPPMARARWSTAMPCAATIVSPSASTPAIASRSASTLRATLASYDVHGVTDDQPDSPGDIRATTTPRPIARAGAAATSASNSRSRASAQLTVGAQIEREWQASRSRGATSATTRRSPPRAAARGGTHSSSSRPATVHRSRSADGSSTTSSSAISGRIARRAARASRRARAFAPASAPRSASRPSSRTSVAVS